MKLIQNYAIEQKRQENINSFEYLEDEKSLMTEKDEK